MKKIDRFLQYLKYKGITENRATVECGLSQGLLHQAKTGRADLGRKTIEKILITYKDLNNVWLLTGEGEMLNAEINNDGIINGNVFSGKGNQNINVALPDIGKQKIIRPDGTVIIESEDANGIFDKAMNEIAAQRKLVEKSREQIDRLLGILERR